MTVTWVVNLETLGVVGGKSDQWVVGLENLTTSEARQSLAFFCSGDGEDWVYEVEG
jgi:hypothetical protein